MSLTEGTACASRGVFYIALGEPYRREARASIASLRRHCPELPVAVLTDEPDSMRDVADVLVEQPVVSNARGKTAAKPRYMTLAPFEQNLFLDTDTRVLEDIRPIFGLLDHYDLAVHFEGGPSRHGGGLHYHTLCNSGVFLFARRPEVADCLARYQNYYDQAYANADERGSEHGLRDQRFLALAIAESRARPCHLGNFMNFTLWEPNLASSAPAVIHGRYEPMDKLGARLRASWREGEWERRLWLPGIRDYLAAGPRAAGPVLGAGLVLKRAWAEWKTRRA